MLHKHKAKISFAIGVVIGIMFILSLSLSRTNIEYNITGINNIKDELVLSIDNTKSIEKAQKDIGIIVDGVTFYSEVIDNHIVFNSSIITDEFYITKNRDTLTFENTSIIINNTTYEYDDLRGKFKPIETVTFAKENKLNSSSGDHIVRISNYYKDESSSYITFEYTSDKDINVFLKIIDEKGTSIPYSFHDVKKYNDFIHLTYKVSSIDAIQSILKVGTSIEDVKDQQALKINLQ